MLNKLDLIVKMGENGGGFRKLTFGFYLGKIYI